MQHDKDPELVLICQGSKKKYFSINNFLCIYLEHVAIVNSQGKVRTSGEIVSGLDFDYEIRSLSKTK